MAHRPLEGIRVLELARVLAGPWAGQLLADLGADVLKVEHPRGDDTRQWGPPFVEHADSTTDAAYFHACNRGKRSVVLDFGRPGDQETVRRLAREADVVIENFKLGGLKRFGLDPAQLRSRFPRLVTCSITGFGQTGPRAAEAGYDFVIQAMSGIMELTGDPQGPPQKVGVAFADIFTGVYAVVGILAALHQRDRTGRGQHVDLSLFDTMVGVLANQALNQLVSGQGPTRLGNAHPNLVPYDVFDAQDGPLVVAVGNDEQFRRLCAVLNLGGLPDDPRFATNAARLAHRGAITGLLAAAVRGRTRSELLDALREAVVPCGPVNTVAEALADPQIVARQMVIERTRSSDGCTIPGIRTPLRFSDAELALEEPSPRLGSSTPHWRD